MPATAMGIATLLFAGCSPGGSEDAHGTEAQDAHETDAHGHLHAHLEPLPGTSAGVLMCPEHGVPEAECGICHPELAESLPPGGSLKVRLNSPEAAGLAGIETGTAELTQVTEGISCLAQLAFDPTRQARVTAPVEGFVESVEVDLGSRVTEGQVLATVLSPAIADAVAKAVLTHQTLEREQRLRADRVTSEEDLQRAEAAHRSACQPLRVLGFSEAQIHAMGDRPEQVVLLPVRAPFAGEIVGQDAVPGARVETGALLFEVVEPALLWAMLKVPEADLARVRTGLPVELRVDAYPEEIFAGTLTWIAPEVDERTRMVSARAEIPNPAGRLKARMFGRARIVTSRPESAVVIPVSAVQRVGGRPFAFVPVEEGLYEARVLRVCARHGDEVEVLAGVRAGERVVTAGGFQLKSQLLLSRLGAGCTHE